MLFVKSIYKKFLSLFFLFWYPNHEWTKLFKQLGFAIERPLWLNGWDNMGLTTQ
jgi:hypothetical protein